jgi:myo-inositol catabolism protein IolC
MITPKYQNIKDAVALVNPATSLLAHTYTIPRKGPWPDGTIVGSPDHRQELEALAKELGATLKWFTDFKFEEKVQLRWHL